VQVFGDGFRSLSLSLSLSLS